jgi:hypothetical protein
VTGASGVIVTGVATDAKLTLSPLADCGPANGAVQVPFISSPMEYAVPDVMFDEVKVSAGEAASVTVAVELNVTYSRSVLVAAAAVRRVERGVIPLGAPVLTDSVMVTAAVACGAVPVTVYPAVPSVGSAVLDVVDAVNAA